MSTSLIMLFRPTLAHGLVMFLRRVVNAVKRLVPEGPLKNFLLMHLWETDPERWAREAAFGKTPAPPPSLRRLRWINRGRIAGQWLRKLFMRYGPVAR